MTHASAASRVRSCIGAVVLATVCLLMMGIARADAATITVTGGATATTQFVNQGVGVALKKQLVITKP